MLRGSHLHAAARGHWQVNYTGVQGLLDQYGWIGVAPFGLSTNNRTGPAACCDPSWTRPPSGTDPCPLAQDKASQCSWNTDLSTEPFPGNAVRPFPRHA